jgi:maleylacetoacetate isomerase
MTIKLFDHDFANAPVRVRIVLALKQIPHERIVVDVYRGRQSSIGPYDAINPQEMVPALMDDDFLVWQSLAIIEYIDERFPRPPMLPNDARGRARVRSLAQMIACDAQPLVNFRVREVLQRDYGFADADVRRWVSGWLTRSLADLERTLASHPTTGRFCYGDEPTLADVLLFPHVLIARRYSVPLGAYPTVKRIVEACAAMPAFANAQPTAAAP